MAELIVPVRILDSPQVKLLLRNFKAGVEILAMLHANVDNAVVPLTRAEINQQLMRAFKRFHQGFNVAARERQKASLKAEQARLRGRNGR